MNAPYDIAGELTALATFIDTQLEDETASRQYIAEQAAERVKAIVAQLGAARRQPNLLGCDLMITQALADGIRWRLARAATGSKRSRRAEAEQAGLHLMAAGQLGLTQQLDGVINVAEVRREVGARDDTAGDGSR